MRVKKKTALIFFLIAFSLVVYLLYASIAKAETIVTDSTTDSEVRSKIDSTTTVKSPPPSAISPSINASNSDLCTVGVSGAVQTQILGISAGKTVRDMNCEKLKNAKTLYDMGMKVGAVAVMCGDERIFKAMMNAGTPCPFDGLVGLPAKEAWNNNQHLIPGHVPGKKEDWNDDDKATAKGAVSSIFTIANDFNT